MPKVSEGFPRKYVNAAEIGDRVLRLTIERVLIEQLDRERKWCMYFVGAKKGLVLNRTNAEYMQRSVHDDSDKWLGLEVDLFTELVEHDGEMKPGIRLRLPKAPETPKSGSDELPF